MFAVVPPTCPPLVCQFESVAADSGRGGVAAPAAKIMGGKVSFCPRIFNNIFPA